MDSTTAIGDVNRGSAARAWYVVAFLSVFYIFSMVDRTIFALLAAPISMDVGLTDAQMSLILGMGFAVVYSFAGLPFAHWLDTRPRKMIVAAGVFLWSVMTTASAFATDFWWLLFFRSGLAFGEAVLTPAAVSMIGDMFARDRRALPMSIYSSMGAIFSTGAFTLGALVLGLATPIAPWTGLAPWQVTLIMLGVPTLLLSLLFVLSVAEPVRTAPVSIGGSASLEAFFRYLRSTAGFYLPLYAGFGLNSCFSFGLYAWVSTIFQREHGVDLTTSGLIFGVVGVVGGVIGTLIIPQVSAKIERALPMRGIPVTLLAVATIQIPVSVFLPLTSSATLLYLCGFVTVLSSSIRTVLASLCFQLYAESRMRARLMAIYLLATGLIGLSIGPFLVVFFADIWPQSDRPLSHGVAFLGVCTLPISVICFGMAYRGIGQLKMVTD
jgi:MFS family permease